MNRGRNDPPVRFEIVMFVSMSGVSGAAVVLVAIASGAPAWFYLPLLAVSTNLVLWAMFANQRNARWMKQRWDK